MYKSHEACMFDTQIGYHFHWNYAFKYLQSENALIFDGVRMFAKAMDDLTAIEGISFPPINCNNYPSSRNWTGGDKLMLYLKVIYAGTVCTKKCTHQCIGQSLH